jgi:4-aminobutyrate aminotransferase-like enzyme
MFSSIRNAPAVVPSRVEEFQKKITGLRGRPTYYPVLPTGRGSGPYLEFMDGSVKLDLISSIGVHLFGHAHPQIVSAVERAARTAPLMQGTLFPSVEVVEFLERLLEFGNYVDSKKRCQLESGWITTCGTMANELALKILRQKKAPAFRLMTFRNSFAGRSSTMQELTDEPKYREGQPSFDQFHFLDFFDPRLSVSDNIERSCSQMTALLERYPNQFCGLGFEPVQGEGGAFRHAPRQWWVGILDFAKSNGLGVWFDEVQTVGRTQEFFAYQTLNLDSYVDVVSLAKPVLAGAVLWTKDFAPRPGLIGGTFASSTANLCAGIEVMKLARSENLYGAQGKIAEFERRFREVWPELSGRLGSQEFNIFGSMLCLSIKNGNAEETKAVLQKAFQLGVVLFSAGKQSLFVRSLPPIGVLTDAQWSEGMTLLAKAVSEL